MPAVTDMLGRTMEVPERPQRIVSLVPSQTELLADLGLEQEVAGITKFCVHPGRWFRTKTRIGGTKTVHIEQVEALKPDLILANKEENVLEQIIALEAIAPVWVSDIHNMDEALDMIRQVGNICGKGAAGIGLANDIHDAFSRLPRQGTGIRTAYAIWRDPWMWAGGDTFINDIMNRCGFDNVLGDVPRYPAIEFASLQALAPELVLLSTEPYPFKDKHIAEVQRLLPRSTVLLADGEMFSWYGSRLLRAPEYLAGLLRSL